ncbi:MAG: hypothetical protein LDL23_01865 [Flavobacterium sp.]|uniref:hypothetical protein n=1 Tax=Flavobacterium sp. TaxID=239 RepID=UPI0025C5E2AA|nr:hypothetical protein [Flavobacterium sp.]MCA1965376.1 hypothetical protein [Flavobacterium sp.]
MKRLSFFILFFTFHLMNAQERTGFYFLAGTNSSSLSTDAVVAKSSGLGYQIGFGAVMGYSERFSTQLEVLYMNNPIELQNVNGNKDLYNFGGYQVNTYLTYNLSSPEEDKLYFGPIVGFLINLGKISSKDDTYDTTPSYFPSGTSKDELLTNSNGLTVGVSFGLNATYNKFKARVSYNYGLSNHFKDVKSAGEIGEFGFVEGESVGDAKMSSISLTLSYKFGRY